MKKEIAQLILIIFCVLIIFNTGYSQSYQEKADRVTDILKEELALSDKQYESVYELLTSYFKSDVDSDLRAESLTKALSHILNPNQIELYNSISVKLHYMFNHYRESGSINYPPVDANDRADSQDIINEPSSGNNDDYVKTTGESRNEEKTVHETVNDNNKYTTQELTKIENEGGIVPAGKD
jgi:hypothetical protein